MESDRGENYHRILDDQTSENSGRQRYWLWPKTREDLILEQYFPAARSSAIIVQVEASLPRVKEKKNRRRNGKKKQPEKGIFKRISREELYNDISK